MRNNTKNARFDDFRKEGSELIMIAIGQNIYRRQKQKYDKFKIEKLTEYCISSMNNNNLSF
jgi:hypothetical protein